MGKQHIQPQHAQSGAVSIFAVIFAALLLTILTVGFIRLMISEQQRATNSDLSQSAYDAALAGIEDAKRVVRACATGSDMQACNALVAPSDCKVVARAGIAGSEDSEETVIQTSTSGNGSDFNQAYTCVNIDMDTPDFLFAASEGTSQLIPLKAGGEFNQITIEWFTQQDVGDGNTPERPEGGMLELPTKDIWGVNAPPVMRAQVITPGESFTLESLNDSNASRTVFLRPFQMADGSQSTNVSLDGISRATDDGEHTNGLKPVTCSKDIEENNGYSCKAILALPAPVTGSASQNAFLRLTTIYRNANVRVQLAYEGTAVKFIGIQPSVDSTGRASNLFRRVEARLQIGNDFPYPSYALDIANSLCKDFSVDSTSVTGSTCQP